MNIYLDYAATTPIDPLVIKVMTQGFKEFGNPSSLHSFGELARNSIEKARETITKAINADPKEIIFTSGGTEANNLAIHGILKRTNKKEIICSSIEHASVLEVCKQLENEGYDVRYLPISSDGIIDIKELKKQLSPNTALVAVMAVNNEVGTIQPINDIANLCTQKDVAFHCDAVQAFRKIPINVKTLHATTISISGHKIYGPKGIGALYIRKGTSFSPLFLGGPQEQGIRAGTENVQGIIGFAKATELKYSINNEIITYMAKRIIKEIPNVILNGSQKYNAPHILNASFIGVDAETLLFHLNMEKIYVSTGSACNSHMHGRSHVLEAMGLDPERIQSAIRFSIGKETTKKDIDFTITKLKTIIPLLREVA